MKFVDIGKWGRMIVLKINKNICKSQIPCLSLHRNYQNQEL
jgi:hypothetical protein